MQLPPKAGPGSGQVEDQRFAERPRFPSVRIPRRLRDLVELAEAELPAGTPDRIGRAQGRAVVDFVAGLTDQQAVGLLEALSGRSRQLWTDAFVL